MDRSIKLVSLILSHTLILAIGGLATPAMPQRAKTGDVTQKVSAQAMTSNGSVRSEIEFTNVPGRGGGLYLTMYLPNADSIKNFDFDEFEGPDAISGRRKLAQVRAQSSTGFAIY